MGNKQKITMIVHGGAGPDSDFIHKNIEGYKAGLKAAVDAGYKILEGGGAAVDAVEAAVRVLEDDPLFNAGKGSELDRQGGVTMCASIMNGKDMKSGAVAIVQNVKNPVTLARTIMDKSPHIYLGSTAALEFAKEHQLEIRDDDYFVTPHAVETYEEKKKEEQDEQKKEREKKPVTSHGTVGAVACDMHGDIAACTSTGGTEYEHEGRIGDSSMVGIGVYAKNSTCAVSTTGQGEYLIENVIGHHLNSLVEYKNMKVNDAAKFLLHQKLKDVKGDMGLITTDTSGAVCMEFNSERMHRAWKNSEGDEGAEIY